MGFARHIWAVGVWLVLWSQAALAHATVDIERAHPSCEVALQNLAKTAVSEIAGSYGVENPEKWVAEVSVREARDRVQKLIRAHLALVEEMESLSKQVQGCRQNAGCLARVGRPLLEKARLTARVLRTTFQTESEVRSHLLDQAAEMADRWITDNPTDLKQASIATEDVGTLKALITEELKDAIQGKKFSLGGFYRQVTAHFAESFRALSFRELRNDPVARTDFLRSVSTVLSLQFGAHLLRNISDFIQGRFGGFTEQLWIYGNTASMMSIQAEVGARNQRKIDEPLPIHGFTEALEELPNILIGERGFWRDTQRKIYGFLALLPLEYAVTVAAKSLNVAISHGPEALLQAGTQREIALVNLASTAIFGSYLSLRWALLDKWFNLNMLPSLRASTQKKAEENLKALKSKGLIPDDWSVKDVYVASKHSKGSGGLFSRGPSKKVRHELELRPEALEKILESEEATALVEAHRTSRRAARVEWAWRYGICLVDSYIVFGLFGSWIPELLQEFGIVPKGGQ